MGRIEDHLEKIGFDPSRPDFSKVHPFDYRYCNRGIFREFSKQYSEKKVPLKQASFDAFLLLIGGLSCLGKVFDGLTTFYGLQLGLYEQNSRVLFLFARFGVVPGIIINVVLSWIGIMIPSFSSYFVRDKMALGLLKVLSVALFGLIYFVVIHNMRLIIALL